MRTFARATLLFSALCLLAGSIVHTAAYAKMVLVVAGSNLPAPFPGLFEGLWLNDALTCVIVALSFIYIAWRPEQSGHAIRFLALLPIASALCIYLVIGNFFPAHLLLLSGAAAMWALMLMQKTAMDARLGKTAQ